MKYEKIRIITTTAGIEIISAALYERGIVNIEISDPRDPLEMAMNLGPSEWYDATQIPEVQDGPAEIICYGDESGAGETVVEDEIREAVKKASEDVEKGLYGDGIDLGTLEIISSLEDEAEWRDRWKEFFLPTRVTDRIVVKPTWRELEAGDKADILIEIDPGMAFGTGTHETTTLALKLLEKYLKPGDRVLDVGVGSGILSIASVKLGASEVLGIDIDEEAVRTSDENFRLNGVEKRARAVTGDLVEGVTFRADIVVANLLSDLVIRLSPAAAEHVRPGGVFISSGILIEKEGEVRAGIEASGFRIEEVIKAGEWCSIAGKYDII